MLRNIAGLKKGKRPGRSVRPRYFYRVYIAKPCKLAKQGHEHPEECEHEPEIPPRSSLSALPLLELQYIIVTRREEKTITLIIGVIHSKETPAAKGHLERNLRQAAAPRLLLFFFTTAESWARSHAPRCEQLSLTRAIRSFVSIMLQLCEATWIHVVGHDGPTALADRAINLTIPSTSRLAANVARRNR